MIPQSGPQAPRSFQCMQLIIPTVEACQSKLLNFDDQSGWPGVRWDTTPNYCMEDVWTVYSPWIDVVLNVILYFCNNLIYMDKDKGIAATC